MKNYEKIVKNAYRAQAKKYHPDAPSGDEEKFKLISEAFEVLSENSSDEPGTKFKKSQNFEFDNSDPNARWAQMREEFAKKSNDDGGTYTPPPPVHKPTPENIVPLVYKHFFLLRFHKFICYNFDYFMFDFTFEVRGKIRIVIESICFQ